MKRIGKLFKGDKVIWVIFFLFTAISLVAVYSSIGRTAIESLATSPTAAFFKHLGIVLFTYTAIIFLSAINYRYFSKASVIIYWLCVALLIFLLATHGQRWIVIKGVGQFQPSEIAKVILIVYTARLLTLKKASINTLETFLRIFISILIIVALIVKENFSTAALVLLSCFVMLIIGGTNKKYWIRTLLLIVVGGVVGLLYFSKSTSNVEFGRSETWGNRVETWLHPNHEELNQPNTAKMAIARGKVFGVGIGNTVHARLMTQADNDFIYAIIIEETGMLGGLVILLLYSIFYLRCIKISMRCKGMFGSLTVFGMGTMIYMQAIVNMSVAVGVIPVTGQTLPFISYGGTAYLFLGCGIGIIQSIAYDNIKQEKLAKNSGNSLASEPVLASENKEMSKQENPS